MSDNDQKTENASQSSIEAMLQIMSGFWVSHGVYVVARVGFADQIFR